MVFDSITPWTIACWPPLSMEFPRQEYWMVCYFLLQGIFPTQGSIPCLLRLLHLQSDSLPISHWNNDFLLKNREVEFSVVEEEEIQFSVLIVLLTLIESVKYDFTLHKGTERQRKSSTNPLSQYTYISDYYTCIPRDSLGLLPRMIMIITLL